MERDSVSLCETPQPESTEENKTKGSKMTFPHNCLHYASRRLHFPQNEKRKTAPCVLSLRCYKRKTLTALSPKPKQIEKPLISSAKCLLLFPFFSPTASFIDSSFFQSHEKAKGTESKECSKRQILSDFVRVPLRGY